MSEENKNTAIPEPEQTLELMQSNMEKMKQIAKKIEDMNNTIEKQQLNQIQQTIEEFQAIIQPLCKAYSINIYKFFEPLTTLVKEAEQYVIYIESLMPYLETELLQLQKLHPEMKNITLQNVLDCMDSNGNAVDNAQKEIAMLIEKAKEKHEADADKGKISVGAKKPDSILLPLDKVTQDIFNCIAAKSCKRTINVEKYGSNDRLDTVITLDFSKLEKSGNLTFKKLTPFEKRVYVACGALQEAGNEYISATQIYKQMGGKGRPAPNQIKKIIESCEGMAGTRIEINNREESEKYNYPRFKKGLTYLFPAESVEDVEINGKTVEYCIRFLKDELPLFTFAKQRKQITAYTLEQWALPFSMTEDNLAIDDYFRARIARMSRDNNKKKSYNGKMLYTAIYEACRIDTRKKRYDATKKFRKLLDHYQKTGIIAGYQERQDGIIIIL